MVWPPDPSQTSGWASQPYPNFWVGFPTHPKPSGGHPGPARTSGWVSHPHSQESHLQVQKGREALLEVREWFGGPFGGPGGVGRPTQWFERGREAYPRVWEGVGRSTQRCEWGRKAKPEVQ